MRRAALCLLAALAVASAASAQQQVSRAPGAVLRGLDKVTGYVTDLDIAAGRSGQLGRLDIQVRECRYPVGNPAGDAYAYLTIRDTGRDEEVFAGWMIASSPALNPLDHARYDVWVLRCRSA